MSGPDGPVDRLACAGCSSGDLVPVVDRRGHRRTAASTWSSSFVAAGPIDVPDRRSVSQPPRSASPARRFVDRVRPLHREAAQPRASAAPLGPCHACALASTRTARYADRFNLYSPLNCYKYPEWWLVFEDRIGYGVLDESDRKDLQEQVRVEHPWSKIIVVNPLNPTTGFELLTTSLKSKGRHNPYQPSPRQEHRSSPSGRRIKKAHDRKR